ncbi:MAG: acetyltransferase [Phascolarctobacterium sp.]|nr:MAG: acetyltransferase [Phascolarctobacterium sp.]
MKIHPEAIIYGGFEIRSPWNIKLGRVVIGVGALLDGRNGIVMEDDVCLAQNVMIFTEQHDLNDEFFRCNDKGGMVNIKDHAWISSRSTILPRVTVGSGAVLACGAIATKDLEPYGVYAGIPAKKVSDRNNNLKYSLGKNNSF